MPFKFTMFWEVANQGWSESWYNIGGLVLPVTNTAPAGAQNLIKTRAACMSNNVVLAGTRTTDLANPRLTSLYIANQVPGTQGNVDYPTTCWLAIAKGPGGIGQRQVWMHGVADTEVAFQAASNSFAPVGGLQASFGAFVGELTNGQWAIRVVQSAKASLNKVVIPQGALVSVPGGVGLGAAPIGVTQSNNIVVGGFKYPLNKLNGTYLGPSGWNLVGGAIVLLNRGASTSAIAGYPGGATVRIQNFSYSTISACNLEFVRERRVGRTFFAARGRRSGK